jgi:hypothetical protein
MKKNTGQSREINRISRQDNLPLLRGMFVSPKSADRKFRPIKRTGNFTFFSEEELVLTPDKGYYLGE